MSSGSILNCQINYEFRELSVSGWAFFRLQRHLKPLGTLTASELYESYKNDCLILGVEPCPKGLFFHYFQRLNLLVKDTFVKRRQGNSTLYTYFPKRESFQLYITERLLEYTRHTQQAALKARYRRLLTVRHLTRKTRNNSLKMFALFVLHECQILGTNANPIGFNAPPFPQVTTRLFLSSPINKGPATLDIQINTSFSFCIYLKPFEVSKGGI